MTDAIDMTPEDNAAVALTERLEEALDEIENASEVIASLQEALDSRAVRMWAIEQAARLHQSREDWHLVDNLITKSAAAFVAFVEGKDEPKGAAQ